ncbi:hypothetical protein DICVIV_05051 [Dictyocaulus viviparus]|uniref:receptor protein serine/threonine kinase n=1 Tax=Dictyocaulus viviparus TaxID=29172 RepID=A0A0D8XVZ7_DICVI|nr:hypothetical protein DICVIV_05051 [Dictyocaulus viviparus]
MAHVNGRLGFNNDIDTGSPFIYCEKFDPKACEPSNPECPLIEQCYAETHNRDQQIGCMTVFKYVTEDGDIDEHKIEVTLKGCWQHDKELIAECKAKDECVAEGSRRQPRPKMEFCCCRSHMCNKKVSIRILDEQRTTNDISTLNISVTPERDVMSDLMNTVWIAMSFAIIGLCIAGILLIFFLIFRCYGYHKVKIQAVTNSQQSETYALLNCTSVRPKFEVTDMKHLASGRFGEVFSAIYRSGDHVEEVAVKVLRDEETWHYEQTIYIDVLNRVAHPNILRYVDAERRNNEYWLITEFMNGGNLYDYLMKDVLSLRQCLRIMSGMLEGLAFLHEAQGRKFTVVHRDIKSKNILLKSAETNEAELTLTACIADFGLATVFSSPRIDDHVKGQVDIKFTSELQAYLLLYCLNFL